MLAVAAGIAVAVAGYQRLGSPEVEGKLGGYRLIDDHDGERDDQRHPGRPVAAGGVHRAGTVRDGSETGRREILVAPSDQATVQVTVPVETSRPPVTGDVYGCGTDIPAYLVATSS